MNADGVNDPQAGSPHLYSGYADWKNWRGEFAPSDHEARYFAAELADVPLAGKRVLEIGFGNGSFLAGRRRSAPRSSAPRSMRS
jgi:hypothetical protein